MQNIQTSVIPFDGLNRKTEIVPTGLTLSQIVSRVVPDSFGEFTAYVTINGEMIPSNMWGAIRPKENAVVGINVVPSGGGDGKNPLATIITIVALVAAPYLAGVYGAGLAASLAGVYGPVTAGQLAFAQGLIRVGVSLAGFLAASSLSGAPTQSNQTRNSNVRESPTQFIEGASNAILKWGVVPANLGTNRMFPPQAALPYTEVIENDQYVRQLFTYGYGNITVEEEKIGETSLTSFTDFEQDDKFDADLSAGTSLFASSVFTDEKAILLEESNGYNTVTTQVDADESILDILFLQGLVYFDEEGLRTKWSVSFTVRYALTGTTDWSAEETFTVTSDRTSVIRKSHRIVFPSKDQYDIQIKRDTADPTSDRVRDEATLTAVKTVEYENPVNFQGISGKAVRIKATDQLNGSIDKYNGVVSTKVLDYDSLSDTWVQRVSSNPASIYRYVLQSDGFAKKLSDSQIDLTALEEWHVYCDSLGLKYNRVIDYETDIESLLNDITASGFASKYNVDGVYSVIVDNEKPVIKGVVTPRNSWGYKGGISYPELPHGLIVEFRNEDKGYAIDERIIYIGDYDETTATLYERIEFSSCTNSDLAYIYGRRYVANIQLQPEIHSFYQDPEFLTLKRGDRFTFVNDAILVGVGSARVKSLVYDDDNSPTEVVGFVVDDYLTIPSTSSFAVRMRYSDASGNIYHPLTTVVGETNTFYFTEPVALTGYVGATDDYLQERQMLKSLCSFVEDGQELDLILLSSESDKNHNAKLRAINYAPERFDIDLQAIPPFESNVTNPLSSYRLIAPVLVGSILSDETAMTVNSDGSYLSRMIMKFNNLNDVEPSIGIRARPSGGNVWFYPEILSSTSEELIITGLQDGKLYDFDIYYKGIETVRLTSPFLQLRNVKHVGGSSAPSDVADFRIDLPDATVGILNWTANAEIDISHYEVRYSTFYTGAVWDTSQILEEFVYENRLTTPFRGGTYLIKAVDILGNYSENASTVTTANLGQVRNVIKEIQEDSLFAGVKDNTRVVSDKLELIDTSLDGYYYFDDSIHIGYVSTSYVTSSLSANGQFVNDIFDIVDIFAESDVFPSGVDNDLFTVDDIFSIEDLFGIGSGSWYVELQYRTTDDDPDASPVWTDWLKFSVGFYEFRKMEFRVLLRSLQDGVTPSISALGVIIDVPDRIVRGEDLTVPVAGASITYDPEFQASPAVVITIQDGATGDQIEFTTKTSSGFSFKVYNTVSLSYVERTYDYISSGYGRR